MVEAPRGLVRPLGAVSDPGVDVLAHCGEHHAEEPAVAAGGVRLQEVEVVLLAFDRAFGAGAGVLMALPEVAVSGDQGMEAIVLLGVGVDDATVGGIGATVGEVRARGEGRGFLGSG